MNFPDIQSRRTWGKKCGLNRIQIGGPWVLITQSLKCAIPIITNTHQWLHALTFHINLKDSDYIGSQFFYPQFNTNDGMMKHKSYMIHNMIQISNIKNPICQKKLFQFSIIMSIYAYCFHIVETVYIGLYILYQSLCQILYAR